MTINRADLPEFLIGLVVVLLGAATTVFGSAYGFGSAASMGSGFFPVIIGATLALLGAAYLVALFVVGSPVAESTEEGTTNVRAIVMISAGIVFWIAAVKTLGLVPATIGMVVCSVHAEASARLVPVLLWAAVLAAAAYGIFVYGLSLPLDAFVWPV